MARELRNYMETLVDNALPQVFKSLPDTCRCGGCQGDIKAIALNSLAPKYISSDKGEVYTRTSSLSAQQEVDVVQAITKAISIVESNPRHDNTV